MNRKVKHNLTR